MVRVYPERSRGIIDGTGRHAHAALIATEDPLVRGAVVDASTALGHELHGRDA